MVGLGGHPAGPTPGRIPVVVTVTSFSFFTHPFFIGFDVASFLLGEQERVCANRSRIKPFDFFFFGRIDLTHRVPLAYSA